MLLFGRIARKHRFVLPDDLEECLVIQNKLRMMGGARRLGEVLIDQGYLTTDHVKWILSRQGGKIPLSHEETLFGGLCVLNQFLTDGSVSRALKIQRKDSKKDSPRRIGEILVAEDEMAAAERDAVLALQKRLRGEAAPPGDVPEPSSVLVLEDGRISRRTWRPIAAAAFVGILLVALVALIAFVVLR